MNSYDWFRRQQNVLWVIAKRWILPSCGVCRGMVCFRLVILSSLFINISYLVTNYIYENYFPSAISLGAGSSLCCSLPMMMGLIFVAIIGTAQSDVIYLLDKKLCDVQLVGTYMGLLLDIQHHYNLWAILVMDQDEEAVRANYCYMFFK